MLVITGGITQDTKSKYYVQTHFSSSLLAQVESPDVGTSEKALLRIWLSQCDSLSWNFEGFAATRSH